MLTAGTNVIVIPVAIPGKVNGITTKYILGSHDETHYKNDQATAGFWIPKCRSDMEYLGQDSAAININGVKIFMDHPGGGSAQALSYKKQYI